MRAGMILIPSPRSEYKTTRIRPKEPIPKATKTFLVGDGQQCIVVEYRRRFGKSDSVFPEIGRRFLGIPLKFHNLHMRAYLCTELLLRPRDTSARPGHLNKEGAR